MTNKLYESMHNSLHNVSIKFDEYCADNEINYIVLCDEANKQEYLINSFSTDDLILIMEQCAISNNIKFEHQITKDGTAFCFEVGSLKEDQYKFPTNKVTRDQSMYRSSFDKSTSFGGKFSKRLNKKLNEETIGILAQPVLFVVNKKSSTVPDSRINNLEQIAKETNDLEVKCLLNQAIQKMSKSQDLDNLDDIISEL